MASSDVTSPLDRFLRLFTDVRAGEGLTALVLAFDTAIVADFDEDVDVTTITLAGGRSRAEGLTGWKEQTVALKSRDKDTAAVYLGWHRETE